MLAWGYQDFHLFMSMFVQNFRYPPFMVDVQIICMTVVHMFIYVYMSAATYVCIILPHQQMKKMH